MSAKTMSLENYIGKWAEKLSKPEDEIKKEYNNLLQEENNLHKDLSEEERKSRALQRLAMTYKKEMRSPAIGFEGMIIAVGDAINVVAKQRREAEQLFRDDPQTAVESGVCDSEGKPLDQRKTWSSGQENRGYGKPLPEFNWLRTIYGVASKKNKDESPRYFVMSMSGKVATNDNIPIFQPVSFRAIDKTSPEDGADIYKLNSSTFTDVKPLEDSNMPSAITLLEKFCNNLKTNIQELGDYHDQHEKDFNRISIVQGDVVTMVLEPTSVGSRRMVIDDNQNLDDLDAQGVTCWVPERINIDFAEQSKVIVIGRTARGKKLDEAGNRTEEPGDVMLNVYGILCHPEYRVELPEQGVFTKAPTNQEPLPQQPKEEPVNKPEIEQKTDNW